MDHSLHFVLSRPFNCSPNRSLFAAECSQTEAAKQLLHIFLPVNMTWHVYFVMHQFNTSNWVTKFPGIELFHSHLPQRAQVTSNKNVRNFFHNFPTQYFKPFAWYDLFWSEFCFPQERFLMVKFLQQSIFKGLIYMVIKLTIWEKMDHSIWKNVPENKLRTRLF